MASAMPPPITYETHVSTRKTIKPSNLFWRFAQQAFPGLHGKTLEQH